jgi:hypothetical protein
MPFSLAFRRYYYASDITSCLSLLRQSLFSRHFFATPKAISGYY